MLFRAYIFKVYNFHNNINQFVKIRQEQNFTCKNIFRRYCTKNINYEDKRSFEFIYGKLTDDQYNRIILTNLNSMKKKKNLIYNDEYYYRYACAHSMYMTLSEYENYCGLKPLFHSSKI